MSKSKILLASEKISTTLSKSTVFEGTIKFTKSLKIDGKFNGEIESSGILVIDEGAVVTATIKTRSLVVAGTVTGNIVATEFVEILATARIKGDIRASRLKIDDGALLTGKCEMIKDANSIDIFSATVDKLKKTVEFFSDS